MYAGGGQRGEGPDQVVSDEQMGSRRPALLVSIKSFQVQNSLLRRGRPGAPLCQRWRGRVVQHDKLRPPNPKGKRLDILGKLIGGEGPIDNSLPRLGHLSRE